MIARRVSASMCAPGTAAPLRSTTRASTTPVPGRYDFAGHIDANTVDTSEPKRDADLRSPNFFDVAKYPTITFKSKTIEQVSAGKLKITGDLTIHGVTKEAVLDVEGPTGPIKDPWGNTRVAANATTKINRQEYGINWNQKMDSGGLVVSDDVNITIDLELLKKAPK